MIQKPRGTRDFLPDEMEARRSTEAKMREAVRRFGYREVCTPEFEDLELFTLRSGEGIMQEMYVFEDKGGRKLALRPEITAAVIRMYINEAKVAPKPLRWCYFADCFRYERPQKGRYRQFWQFGAELIGADTAMADAEVIMLASEALNATGVTWDLKVGHLAFMRNLLAGLEPAAQRRVMAHLDKKDFEGLAATLEGMGKSALNDSLTALVECRTLKEAFEIAGAIPEKDRVEQTMAILDAAGVKYSLNFGIARGLDYYTGMVFEGFAHNLGAENQILGGGGVPARAPLWRRRCRVLRVCDRIRPGDGLARGCCTGKGYHCRNHLHGRGPHFCARGCPPVPGCRDPGGDGFNGPRAWRTAGPCRQIRRFCCCYWKTGGRCRAGDRKRPPLGRAENSRCCRGSCRGEGVSFLLMSSQSSSAVSV